MSILGEYYERVTYNARATKFLLPIIKTGSFTLAAQSMNITQSAFSAQMKKLERLVGVKLISRSTRGSRLTPEGELFLPEAEQVLDTLERAIQSIR